MELVILIVVMIVIGAVIGALAGRIWKDERPYGLAGDLVIGALTAVIVGLLDWFVIPAIGFSQSLVLIGVASEPALSTLLVLWLLRRARR